MALSRGNLIPSPQRASPSRSVSVAGAHSEVTVSSVHGESGQGTRVCTALAERAPRGVTGSLMLRGHQRRGGQSCPRPEVEAFQLGSPLLQSVHSPCKWTWGPPSSSPETRVS